MTEQLQNPWTNFIASVRAESSRLQFEVQAKIIHLTWEQVEPEKREGQIGMYFKDRPKETFVVYILSRVLLETLAQEHRKSKLDLSIHKNVNTQGEVRCWPARIDSMEDAKTVLSDWAWLIGALYLSDKGSINEFYHSYPEQERGNWVTGTISAHQVTVAIKDMWN